jgi:very-short-patch-repair endonuclease
MARRIRSTLEHARAMRREPAPAETKLWSRLKAGQLNGFKFTRQVVFGIYVADFACRSERLVIELDGDSHAGREAYDARRTAYLEWRGYRVLRFGNAEVHGNLEGVLEVILQTLEAGRGQAD